MRKAVRWRGSGWCCRSRDRILSRGSPKCLLMSRSASSSTRMDNFFILLFCWIEFFCCELGSMGTLENGALSHRV
ncbi:phosducin-like protein 3 [Iris pallida]|uniref:Phosducin-like protein 3 n=1 Tax=Iris pallida TaxID=29817 RepID=A0AAX6FFP3_IRIPA|nr:phosducin-like protein 3 [Iris pallida]